MIILSIPNSRKSWNAVLTLKTIPRLSTDGPTGQKFIVEWMSPSSYIGKEMTGKYLIKRISNWTKMSVDAMGSFTTNVYRTPSAGSLILGLAHRPSSTFIILSWINPNKSGFGMLDYKPQIISSGVSGARPRLALSFAVSFS
jgi:hypothetical protein